MHYAELHCKTNFSFLEGASHADELATRAVELGYSALAVTDRESLSGVVRAHAAAKDAGLKLIVGAEVYPIDAAPAVLWATDRDSYGRLSRLITIGRRRAAKGECQLTIEDVAQQAQGLLVGVLAGGVDPVAAGRSLDECSSASLKAGAVANGDRKRMKWDAQVAQYRDIFADRCYLLASLHRGPDDQRLLEQLQQLSQTTRAPLAASGDVHYHVAGRKPLHDVLVAIRHGTTVDAAGDLLQPNAQRHLKSLEEISWQFASAPDAIARTLEIAERCRFSLEELQYEYPSELSLLSQVDDQSWLPPVGWQDAASPREGDFGSVDAIRIAGDQHADDRPLLASLVQLTRRGAKARYPRGLPMKVRRQIEHELQLIDQLRYEAYFLTVWDLVRFARSRGILCQGRGSAANSAVCYCLGVTSVDPARLDLLFERFVSRERNEAPDIDVDFEHERREEVLQYLYDKYGRDRAGMTAEVICYRPRSAVRDVGKALGLSLDRIDALAKNLEGYSSEPQLAERCRMSGIDPDSPTGRRLIDRVEELLGFPRHLSQHVGGMVMTDRPLCELAPIENAAMQDRTVLSWDKNDLDALGILKVDCLALGMLTAIRKCFDLLADGPEASDDSNRQEGDATPARLSLSNIPPEDPAVYEMIASADTMGVFQIESRAQMSMLPRLRPARFYDLVIEVAIVRPGPIQGEMVHPYLRRRNNEEPVTYPNEAVRQVLQKTLGVPLFQEQAMRLAVVAAGFTPGEADELRRAMGAWRKTGVIEKFRLKMLEGMRANGLAEEFAERLFNQLRGFGEYGFPESHAASFALLVYVSAWLKRHHPAAFTAALLNSQPMGFYAPAQLVRNLIEHGGRVLPVDVNHSQWDCTLEQAPADESAQRQANDPPRDACQPPPYARECPAMRLGIRTLSGMSESSAEQIVGARATEPFTSVDDFSRRTRLGRAVVERLAEADAFASLQIDRRAALWEALDQQSSPEDQPLFAGLVDADDPPQALPRLTEQQQVFADYRAAGLSLRGHPLAFYRDELCELGVTPADRLVEREHDAPICVAGLVLMRQRPSTAKGITFITLEDETGVANLVVHVQTWERFYKIARRSSGMIARGRLERKGQVIHVVVQRLEDLSEQLDRLRTKSRDFR